MRKILNEDMPISKLEGLPIVPIDGRVVTDEGEKKYLKEIGVYEFSNLEDARSFMKFCYGSTKNQITFTLMHGGTYRLPKHVANWIESRGSPQWKWSPDGSGRLDKRYDGKKNRAMLRPVFG